MPLCLSIPFGSSSASLNVLHLHLPLVPFEPFAFALCLAWARFGGMVCMYGNGRLWTDPGPDQRGNVFLICILALSTAVLCSLLNGGGYTQDLCPGLSRCTPGSWVYPGPQRY